MSAQTIARGNRVDCLFVSPIVSWARTLSLLWFLKTVLLHTITDLIKVHKLRYMKRNYIKQSFYITKSSIVINKQVTCSKHISKLLMTKSFYQTCSTIRKTLAWDTNTIVDKSIIFTSTYLNTLHQYSSPGSVTFFHTTEVVGRSGGQLGGWLLI